eukprot:12925506-Prorocentrum_lima.AAC.1
MAGPSKTGKAKSGGAASPAHWARVQTSVPVRESGTQGTPPGPRASGNGRTRPSIATGLVARRPRRIAYGCARQ